MSSTRGLHSSSPSPAMDGLACEGVSMHTLGSKSPMPPSPVSHFIPVKVDGSTVSLLEVREAPGGLLPDGHEQTGSQGGGQPNPLASHSHGGALPAASQRQPGQMPSQSEGGLSPSAWNHASLAPAQPPNQAQGTSSLGTQRHKASRDLSPIKQRTLQFRTGIGRGGKMPAPNFSAASLLGAALDYALPPSAPGPSLTPALLADLRVPEGHVPASTAGLVGAFSLPSSRSGGDRSPLTNFGQKMPYHSAIQGVLPIPPIGVNTTAWLGGATATKTTAEHLMRLWSSCSHEEAYTFDVPQGVATGLDAVKLFSSSGAKPGLIIFCSLNPTAKEYNPYDLIVVPPESVDRSFFYIITQSGVTHMWGGVAYDLVPHHEWIRDAELFAVLKKLVLFAKHSLFKAFRKWHGVVRSMRFEKRGRSLTRSLIMLSPTFGPALRAIRRMTLAATHDPAGSWKKRTLAGGGVTWVHSNPDLYSAGDMNEDLPDEEQDELSVFANVPSRLPPRNSHDASASGVAPGRSGNSASGVAPAGLKSGSSGSGAPPPPAPLSAHASFQPASNTLPVPAVPAAPSLLRADNMPALLQKEGSIHKGGRGRSDSITGATVAPEHSLLLPGEDLPEGGLAVQLGSVGSPTDLYTLEQFKHLRSQAKAQVQDALSHMTLYVVDQVREVGQAVAGRVRAASLALAPLTRKQAFERKFEHVTGRDTWQHGSPYFANEAQRAREERLAEALAERDQLHAFLGLTDALVISAMYDLARLALALACHMLFQPRRHGLFLVHATVVQLDRGYAAELVRPLSQQAARHSGTPQDGDRPAEEGSPVSFSPSCEQVVSTVVDVVRETLAVVAQASLGVTSHPDIRELAKQLFGNTAAAAAILKEQHVPPTAGKSGNSESGYRPRTSASSPGAAGGRTGALLDQLRGMLHVQQLMDQLEDRVVRQYYAVLSHVQLQPFVAHQLEWALVCAYEASSYQAARHPPDKLHADLQLVRTWMEDLAKCGTTSEFGLMHFDLASTREVLLPPIVSTFSSMMAGLTSLMSMLQKDLLARLARYIDRLRNRPSELPDFVAYMELVWPHLDDASFKRQRVKQQQENLLRLYQVIMAAVPKPDDPEPRHTDRPGSPGDGSVALPTVSISVRDARPIHLMWKQVQAEVSRYSDEAAAAADFFQHSSALMTNHLKNNLLQMESDLLQLLTSMRLGSPSTLNSKSADVFATLTGLDGQMGELLMQGARCTAWAKLLSHPSVTQLLATVERLMEVSRTLLDLRRTLWGVLARWEVVLDGLYQLPASSRVSKALLRPVTEALDDLDKQVVTLTAAHINDDVSSTTTVTPQEAKLGAHYSLVVSAWRDMLRIARTLAHDAVKPRHISILLTWLHTCSTTPHPTPSDLQLAERYPVPAGDIHVHHMAHVDDPNHHNNPHAKPGTPLVHVAPHASHGGGVSGNTTLAQLLSRCTETDETRMLAARAVQVAHSEHELVMRLAGVHSRLSGAELCFASQRVAGAFVITNSREVVQELADLQGVLDGVRASPSWAGVMHEYEMVEQLLAQLDTLVPAALSCQDLWCFLSVLLSTPEAQAHAGAAVSAHEPLLGVWRKYTLSARETPGLLTLGHVMPELLALRDALVEVQRMATGPILSSVRAAYPRTMFVPDHVLLEGVAAAQGDLACLPAQLLATCFTGLQRVHVASSDQALDAAEQEPMSPPPTDRSHTRSQAAQGAAQPGSPTAHRQAPSHHHHHPQVLVAVTGSHGDTMTLVPELVVAPGTTLARMLTDLEGSLKASLRAHMLQCMQACGHVQADKWVSSFPSQVTLLVDAVVWTQAVSSALVRVAEGERMALRNLLDQVVLRLEGLAQQMRALQQSSAASSRPGSSSAGGYQQQEEEDGVAQGDAPGVHALRALITAGVAHRQVVEGLVAADSSSPECWEWVQHVRHYWDHDYQLLYVAFAQTRLTYGWEYQGSPLSGEGGVLPSSTPNLLAAVNALQTSPIVHLSMQPTQVCGASCVEALARLLGKFCVTWDLAADDTAATSARVLHATLMSDSWLCLQGLERLSLQVLSLLGAQLHAVWSSYYHGTASVRLPLGPSSSAAASSPFPGPAPLAELTAASPWARAAGPDAPVPASLFLTLPMDCVVPQAYTSSLLGEEAAGACQLDETLRRVSRTIRLAAPDATLVLEAGLRDEGLRDAAEAARSVECCYRLAAMQLPARPQYALNLITVKALLAAVRQRGNLLPDFTPTTNHHLPTTSALDAAAQALRLVLLASAHEDDAPLLARLVEQATSTRARSPAAPPPGPVAEYAPIVAVFPGAPSLQEIYIRVHSLAAGSQTLPTAAQAHGHSTAHGSHTFSPFHAAAPAHVGGGHAHAALVPEHAVVAPPAWLAALRCVPAGRLATEAGRLAVSLGAFGSCLLVGPPGCGKTLVWKALVAAVSGPGVLQSQQQHPTCPQLLHLYPAALPMPPSLLEGLTLGSMGSTQQEDAEGGGGGSNRGSGGSRSGGDSSASHHAQAWLLQLLQSPTPAGLQAAMSDLQQGGGGRLSRDDPWNIATAVPAGMAPAAPAWLVIDAPLGSLPSEALMPLLSRRGKQCCGDSGGGGQVLGLPAASKVVWECSSVSGASPALLSAVPIMYMGSQMVDVGLVAEDAAAAAVRKHLGRDAAAGEVGKRLAQLLLALFQRMQLVVVGGSPLQSQQILPKPSGPAFPTTESVNLSSTTSIANQRGPSPPHAEIGLSVSSSETTTAPQLGMEHGVTFFGTALKTASSLLLEMASSLEHPSANLGGGHHHQPAESVEYKVVESKVEPALTRLARAALFATYWTAAALPLSHAQRVAVEAGLKDAAASCGMEHALPGGGEAADGRDGTSGEGGVAAHMLDPHTGMWCTWAAAVGPIMAIRHGIHKPDGWAMPVSSPEGSPGWHLYTDPLTGQPSLYVPGAVSAAMQHVSGLLLRAGARPLVLGGAGAGRAALLRHLAATAPLLAQRKTEVLGLALSPGSRAWDLTQLLSWVMTSSMLSRLRAPLGRHLLLLVEDISAVVQAAPAPGAAAGGPGAEVVLPCLEWMRQLMDAERVVAASEAGRLISQHVADLSLAATACPDHLIRGPQQAPARLWRHFAPLHIDAALAADPSASATHTLPNTVSSGPPLPCLFHPLSLLACVSHSSFLRMATGPARVPELLALGPVGVGVAGQVLGSALHKLLHRVAGLERLGLARPTSDFGVTQLVAVMQRVTCAAGHVAETDGNCWSISDVVHRLMFEVGQQLSGSVATEADRDVMGRVTLQAMGRELGALLTGKFDPHLTAPPPPAAPSQTPTSILPIQGADTIVPAPGNGESIFAFVPSAEVAAVLVRQEAEDKSTAALWQDYATSADGPSMTALRVSLIGKVSPSDINKLVAAARADALISAGRAVLQSTTSTASTERKRKRQEAGPDASPTGASKLLDPRTGTAGATWPNWLHVLPVSLDKLPALVQQLVAGEMRETHTPDGRASGFSLHHFPAENKRVSIDGEITPRADSAQQPTRVPTLQLSRLAQGAGNGSRNGRGGGRQQHMLSGTHAELALEVMHDWELISSLVAAASNLAGAAPLGCHHVVMTGPDPTAMLHLAQLAVISSGNQLMTLVPAVGSAGSVGFQLQGAATPPSWPVGSAQAVGAGWSGQASSLRGQLWDCLKGVLQAAGGDAANQGTNPHPPAHAQPHHTDPHTQQPHHSKGAAPPTAPSPQGTCLCLVIGEAAASDDGVMELLQLLLTSPLLAAHALAAAAGEDTRHEYQDQMHQMLHPAGDGDMHSPLPPSSKRSHLSSGTTAAAAARSSPRAVAVAVDGLRKLTGMRHTLASRGTDAIRPSATRLDNPTLTVAAPSTHAPLASQRSIRERDHTAGLGLGGAGGDPGSPVGLAPRHAASMTAPQGANLRPVTESHAALDDLHFNRVAQNLVSSLHHYQDRKVTLMQSAAQRLTHQLRLVLAVSPATARRVLRRHPHLAHMMLHVAVPALANATQESVTRQHLLSVAQSQEESMLACIPPLLPTVNNERSHAQQTTAALFAARCLADGEAAAAAADASDVGVEAAEAAAAVAAAMAAAAAAAAAVVAAQGTSSSPDDGVDVVMTSSPEQDAEGTLPDQDDSEAVMSALREHVLQQTGADEDEADAAAAAMQTGNGAAHGDGSTTATAAAAALDTAAQQSKVEVAAGLASAHSALDSQSKVAAQRAGALAGVLLEVHRQAQELLQQQGMLQQGARLPLTKVEDVVEVLARIHGAQCKMLRTQQASLWVSLQKLGPAASEMAVTSSDAATLTEAIASRTKQLNELERKLATLTSYELHVSRELAAQQALVDKHGAIVYAVTAEVDTAMELAHKRYRQALQEVGGLTEGDLAELRSYSSPHERVRLVMMAVTAVFDAPADWRSAQKLLGEQNPKLLERLINFDVRSVSMLSLAKLARITSEPEFNIVQVAQVSKAAKPLCWWALSVHELLRVGREADLKRLKIEEAETRLEEAKKYVRQLRGELMASRNEKARRQAARDAALADVAEMQAIINDQEASCTNARKLEAITGMLTASWLEELKTVEGQLRPLLGDATLTALAVVYVGSLLPAQRNAALEHWRGMLQEAQLPVSSSFDLTAFLSVRQQQLLNDTPASIKELTPPAWLDALSLAVLAGAVPLILDPGLELVPLLKAQQPPAGEAGRPAGVTCLSTLDSSLASQVESAVFAGDMVVVDLEHGDEGELQDVLAALVVYRHTQRLMFNGHTHPPHRLFLRLRRPIHALSPGWHRWTCLQRLGWDRPQLTSTLRDTLVALCDPEAAMALREARTKVAETREECQALGAAVMYAISHTRGPVYADDVLVDSTIARAQQAAATKASLPTLVQQLTDIESRVLGRHHDGLLDAALLVHHVLTYMDAHRPLHNNKNNHYGAAGGDGGGHAASTVPPHLFVHVFRAAATATLGSLGLLQQQSQGEEDRSKAGRRHGGAATAVTVVTGGADGAAAAPGRGAGSPLSRSTSPTLLKDDSLQTLPSSAEPSSATVGSQGVQGLSPLVGVQGLGGLVGGGSSGVLGAPSPVAGGGNGVQGLSPLGGGVQGSGVAAPRWQQQPGSPSPAGAGGRNVKAQQQGMSSDAQRLMQAMLSTLTQLICGYLTAAQADTLRLLIALHLMRKQRSITSAELQFTLTLLREGMPATTTEPTAPTTSTTSRSSAASPMRQQLVLNSAASLPAPVPAPPPSPVHPLLSPLATAALTWLERAYPTPAFVGLPAVVRAAPAPWRAALWADDLSAPLITANHAAMPGLAGAAGIGGDGTGKPAGPILATLSDLASLSSLAAAIAGSKRGTTTGDEGILLTPEASRAAGDLPAPAAAATAAKLGDAAAAAAGPTAAKDLGISSLVAQASALLLAPPGPGAAPPPPTGPLPEQWARARLRSPLHWFLLAVTAAGPDRLAPASRWLASYVIEQGVAPADPTPGERLLQAVLATPAACATVVTTCQAEDAVAAAHQAAAAWGAGATGLLQPPEAAVGGERDVVTMSWGSFGWHQLVAALQQAVRAGQWLLLLNCHVAPKTELLRLLRWMAEHEYLLRGDDVSFRLFLALPHAAVRTLPPQAFQQGLLVPLQPPTSLLASARGAMTLLAHSSASYVGFYAKAADPESHSVTLGAILAFAALLCTMTAASDVALPMAFGWWDVLHALHLAKLLVGEARKHDPSLDARSLDYSRLRELLLGDVFLPACPSPHLAPHVQAVVTALLAPNVLSADYPCHRLQPDRDMDATEGTLPPTHAWPFTAPNLTSVLGALDSLLDTRATGLRALTPASALLALGLTPARPGGGAAAAATAGLLQQLQGAAGAVGTAPPPSQTELQALGQSLACGGAWPLQGLLRYCGSAVAQRAGHASWLVRRELGRLRRQAPGVAEGFPAGSGAVAGPAVAGRGAAAKPTARRGPAPVVAVGPLTQRDSITGALQLVNHTSMSLLEQLGSRPAPQQAAAAAPGHQQQHPAGAARVVARAAAADVFALVPVARKADAFSPAGAVALRVLLPWLGQQAQAAAQLLARLSTRLQAEAARPRALSSSMEVLLLEALQREVLLLLDQLLVAGRSAQALAAALAGMAGQAGGISQPLRQLAAGMLPQAWQAAVAAAQPPLPASGGGLLLQPLAGWQQGVSQRLTQWSELLAVLVAPGSLQAGGSPAGHLPVLSLDLLRLPLAPMAVLMRAHASEQSVQLAHVCCKAVPLPDSTTLSTPPTSQWPHTGMWLASKHGLRVTGLHVRDGVLLPLEDVAGMSALHEVFALGESGQGEALAPCTPLWLLPSYVELRTRSTHVSRAGSRPHSNAAAGGRNASTRSLSPSLGGPGGAGAGGAGAGGAGGADIRNGIVPLAVPVVTSQAGAVLGDAAGMLHLLVRQAQLPAGFFRPYGGSALLDVQQAPAPLAVRSLCLVVGGGPEGGASLAANVAREEELNAQD